MSESQLKTEVTLYGELVIYSGAGEVTYRGKPDEYPVKSASVTSDEKVVVLLTSSTGDRFGSFRNLLLVDAKGKVIWRAEFPECSWHDAYVAFHLSSDRLFANSWSCYRVEINLKDGKLLSQEFVK